MKTLLLLPISLIALYLFLSAVYQLALAIAARYFKPVKQTQAREVSKLVVLVPTYAENEVILHSTKKNLTVSKPEGVEVDYLVIADQVKPSTCIQLCSMGAEVLEVKFDQSTKVKALQAAMDYLKGRNYDAAVILDADNVMESNFLLETQSYLNTGYSLIQGQRLAANSNSDFALLDGLSEAANTEMLCKGANVLGFSSKLSGSAMVFDYSLFEEAIPTLKAIGGFDKELELYFTSGEHYIQYAPELAVWDEKVASAQAFSKQRGRWLQSQYAFLRKSFLPALKSLKQGNVDYFHKSLQLALPPRALAPFLLVLVVFLGILLDNSALLMMGGVGFLSLMTSYVLSLSSQLGAARILIIAKALPGLFLSSIRALGWMSKAKKQFIHTKHQVVQS
ncbi:cellulose synthase/poly-beta-1,6-N-acetylglucosamine synthase-like glycosyltransferase [Algoriphagus boseongensis]|uniref:Cellulose synthase/poly-beta-1,6-N-acetylglucosamine synthase-like glycosyltransferase n=1 Tax=Algoriphagus boseongensis TaxID=1442587 RepID=A0A4R6T831_9BACT|nr:glycosyltransferase family 2 protein [Algoriphagus boseongensis]TDQ17057.1 cellulose synthase/poly-beta-1,6-N-acetylglucosamine synthase-like glycosyltransferase [Algoriphagus boseongensis]